MRIFKCIIIAIITISFVRCTCNQKNDEKSTIVELVSVVDIEKLDSNVQLIDVRTPEEYSEGYIKNAKNINLFDDDFLNQISKLDKNKPIYVYCRSGKRSSKAANQLKEAGFTAVYNLEGGVMKWISENKALT